jgi:hypothetical protein
MRTAEPDAGDCDTVDGGRADAVDGGRADAVDGGRAMLAAATGDFLIAFVAG